MGLPQQNIIIEVAKDNWSWLKWILGIVSGVIISFLSAVLINRALKRKT